MSGSDPRSWRLWKFIPLALVAVVGCADPPKETAEKSRLASIAFQTDICIPESRAPGEIVVSSYGTVAYHIDHGCRVTADLLDGPVNVLNPGPGFELGIVNGRPLELSADGKVVFDGLDIYNQLMLTKPKEFKERYFHHDIVKTKWGTYLAIMADVNQQGLMDDVLIEFDTKKILKRLSLNTLLLGGKFKALKLAYPYTPEDWLHTNSLDTRADGTVMVSTRNINEVQFINWTTGKVIGSFGKGTLSLQHYVKFQPDGTILVFDNGAIRKKSGIATYSAQGQLLEYKPLPFFNPAYGSVQKLSNGNWLICSGVMGDIYEFSNDLSKTYLHMRLKSKEYVSFHKMFESILYRAVEP